MQNLSSLIKKPKFSFDCRQAAIWIFKFKIRKLNFCPVPLKNLFDIMKIFEVQF